MKKFTVYVEYKKRRMQKKIGSFFLPHGVHMKSIAMTEHRTASY